MSTYTSRTAARLRHLREQQDLSVADLADAMDSRGWPISTQAIYAWELGSRKVHLDALPYLADALGCSPRRLMPSE